MTRLTEPAAEAAIDPAGRELHVPTVDTEAGAMADQAAKARLTHRAYLAESSSPRSTTGRAAADETSNSMSPASRISSNSGVVG